MASEDQKLTNFDIDSIPADVLEKISQWNVKSAFLIKGENAKRGTSKMHRFKPSVTLRGALTWADSAGTGDATFMFENDSAISFQSSRFSDFEDLTAE
eukprot:TRINITY_DN724_c0_g2_i1.p2 TRINITY_DN724_c0_g2~~TRINITY_DN724_c0_g2_i1.p2  ORF type:complete len:114 (+),score=44.81 TRINITY_DN724_c0_g2_i1:50-343(+)